MTGKEGGVPASCRDGQGPQGKVAGTRRRRRGLGAGAVALALGALVMTPTPAGAQSFGPGACEGGCYYADNSLETYYYSSLNSATRTSIEFARASRLESTDMTTDVYESANNDTDILVYDELYPVSSWAGVWMCDLLVSGSSTKCNRGHITFNLRFGSPNYALACQEQGHAVGLDHSTSTGSCMHQDSAVAATYYDTHDKGHINGYY